MSVKITMTARSGGSEIGASLYDYEFEDSLTGLTELVRIDAGMRPSNFRNDVRPIKLKDTELARFIDSTLVMPKTDPLPNWDTVREVKTILGSHGHLDHAGCIPVVLRKHRNAVVYATDVTKALYKIQWYSTPAIAKRRDEIPLFLEEDAEFALSKVKEISHGQRIKINENLEVEAVNAGHLLGAVSFVFYWQGKPVGFHAVDLSIRNNQRSVPDAPEVNFENLRFLTIESTRIAEKNESRSVVEDELMRTVEDAYYNKGMKIRILAFSIGRVQEVFALVKEACPDAPIWIDGQAREVSLIYAEHLGGVFKDIASHFILDNDHRGQLIHSTEPNIVLVPSAMQFGGFSRKYVEHGCGLPDHLFISPGYRDPRSPEYAFFASNSHYDVFEFGAHRAARMCQTATFSLTSHCDGDDVLEMQRRLNPDQVLLVHGEPDKMNQFISDHAGQGFVIAENNKPIVV